MSNLTFPTLPGLDIAVEREPYDGVQVDAAASAKEVRSTWETYERYRYKLRFNFLRDGSQLEWQRLVGFRTRHGGSLDSFPFTDPQDNAVAAHPFGVGDGSTLTFQLQRTIVPAADLAAANLRSYWPVYGDGYEPVTSLNGNPSIFVDTGGGPVLKTLGVDYTLPGFGAVLWASAPAVGAILTWTGSYFRRCRFADQSLPTVRIVFGAWKCSGDVNLVSVKEEEVPPSMSSSGSVPHFDSSTAGTLTGTINGTTGSDGNPTFTLAAVPQVGRPILGFRNGEQLTQGADFTVSGSTITALATNIPIAGDSYGFLYFAAT